MINCDQHIKPATSGIGLPRFKRWALFLLLLSALSGLLLAPERAQAGSKNLQEYEIKVAFIYNFAKYVKWPEKSFSNPQEPLILGLLGDQPFGAKINKINGKMVHDRELKVIAIKDYEELKKCHLLYISASESNNLKKIWPLLEKRKILTISDMADFVAGGGMIELVVVNDKIRFIIDSKKAEHAGLNISSQLLKLAIIYNQEAPK